MEIVAVKVNTNVIGDAALNNYTLPSFDGNYHHLSQIGIWSIEIHAQTILLYIYIYIYIYIIY